MSPAPEAWLDRLKGGHQPAALSAVLPRIVKAAACQQIVRLASDIDLGELPMLQWGYQPEAKAREPAHHRPRLRFGLV